MRTSGIYSDISMTAYVGDPCPEPSLSTGTAQLLLTRSPLHAWWFHPRLGCHHGEESSRAELGSAVHATLFGGETIVYAPEEFNDWRKKDAQTFRDGARERGEIPLLAKQRTLIETIAGPAQERIHQLGVIQYENTILWDALTWNRSRPDAMSVDRRVIVDYKTASIADPAAWIRSCLIQGGYDIQAGLVLDGLRTLEGEQPREFLFLVQEIEPPYCLSVVGLGPEFLELASRKVAAAQSKWADCLASKKFPAYDQRTHYAEPPTWAMMQEFES